MTNVLIIGEKSTPSIYIESEPDVVVNSLHFHAHDLDNGIPISLKGIYHLMKLYDAIILQKPVYTNDSLLQGSQKTINQFMIDLFLTVAKRTNTALSIHSNDTLEHLHQGSLTNPVSFVHSDNDKFEVAIQRSKHTVTSVQCWDTYGSIEADDWAYHYFSWLSSFTKKLIKVKIKGQEAHFHLRGIPFPLLVLEKTNVTEQMYISEWIIKRGVLNKTDKQKAPVGRLWFVLSSDPSKKTIATALTHFRPRLPWTIYKFTQGVLHPYVMNQFKKQSCR
ncbi:hypothetical protein CR194_06990 [Salipaludibacillus keqinensis]|uniref:Uncharacterized protein n=1 Tax=Salipaludibacillus keqinensis TaxID=2045207 RepID=A0A323TJF9_9BACI|nr:hypothetical protein [Salipaludibacillus keqinensis]PYZ95252.1 hypothetical protein CR194_06990 [Salipaludibacillus keqinensis]